MVITPMITCPRIRLFKHALTQDDPNARPVIWMTELFVDRRQIKIHFARKLRFELLDFQIDHHEAAQTQVVEQQVEIKIWSPTSRRYWLPTKAKPLPNSRINERRCSSRPRSRSRSSSSGPRVRKSKL